MYQQVLEVRFRASFYNRNMSRLETCLIISDTWSHSEKISHKTNMLSTIKSQVLASLVLQHMEAFSDCFMKVIHMYCELLEKS